MINCIRCGNETRTSELITSYGPVMLAGPQGSAPQPIQAYVCTACGHVELYGPLPIADQPQTSVAVEQPTLAVAPESVPAVGA